MKVKLQQAMVKTILKQSETGLNPFWVSEEDWDGLKTSKVLQSCLSEHPVLTGYVALVLIDTEPPKVVGYIDQMKAALSTVD